MVWFLGGLSPIRTLPPFSSSVRFAGQPSGTYLSRTEQSLAACFGLCSKVEVHGKAGGVEYGEAIIKALSEC
jgi:hypothetical protein